MTPANDRNWVKTGLNNFRQNILGDLDATRAPDLTDAPGWNQCTNGEGYSYGSVTVSVCNRGSAPVGVVPVSFYVGQPSAAMRLCLKYTSGPLQPGSCGPVVCTWPDATSTVSPTCPIGQPVYVRADDDGTGGIGERECIETNNTAIVP